MKSEQTQQSSKASVFVIVFIVDFSGADDNYEQLHITK